MGQQTSEEGEFGCDSCRKIFKNGEIRIHCLFCKDVDLCKNCFEEESLSKQKNLEGHQPYHKTIKIFHIFPADCVAQILKFLDISTFQTTLAINSFFRSIGMGKEISHYCGFTAIMFKIPKEEKPYIRRLTICDKKTFKVSCAKLFYNVRILEIIDCKLFDKCFMHTPRLTNLVLKNCKGISGVGFKYLPNLKDLTIDNRPKIHDGINMRLFEYLGGLETLDFAGGTFSEVKYTVHNKINLKNLRKLKLTSVSAKSNEVWENFFKCCSSIENLSMSRSSFVATVLKPLVNLKNIDVNMSFMVGNFDGTIKEDIERVVPENCNVVYKRKPRYFMCL